MDFCFMAKIFIKTKDICNTSDQIALEKAANFPNQGQIMQYFL